MTIGLKALLLSLLTSVKAQTNSSSTFLDDNATTETISALYTNLTLDATTALYSTLNVSTLLHSSNSSNTKITLCAGPSCEISLTSPLNRSTINLNASSIKINTFTGNNSVNNQLLSKIEYVLLSLNATKLTRCFGPTCELELRCKSCKM